MCGVDVIVMCWCVCVAVVVSVWGEGKVLHISSYGNSNKTGSTRVNGGLIPSDWCQ